MGRRRTKEGEDMERTTVGRGGGHKEEEVTRRKRTEGEGGHRKGRTQGEGRGHGDLS